MSKSSTACAMSIENLLKGASLNRHGASGYMWTFTLQWTAPIKDACRSWSALSKMLVSSCDFEGVRVFELHPGVDDRSHGLHVHAVSARYYRIHDMRAVCSAFGWSCHVGAIRKTALYVCKYLHKSVRAECLAGRRLWAAVGLKPVKVGTGVFKSVGRGHGKNRRYSIVEVKRTVDRLWNGAVRASRTCDLELHSLRAAAWAMALKRRREGLYALESNAPANCYRQDYGVIRAQASRIYRAMFEVADNPVWAGDQAERAGTPDTQNPKLDYMKTFFDGDLFYPKAWRAA